MGWNILSSGAFALALIMGGTVKHFLDVIKSKNILSIEVSQELDIFYLAVPLMSQNLFFAQKNISLDKIQDQIEQNFNTGYNPIKEIVEKNPEYDS